MKIPTLSPTLYPALGSHALSMEEVDRKDWALENRLLERVGRDGSHGHAAIEDLGVARGRGVHAQRVDVEHAGQVLLLLAKLPVEVKFLRVDGAGDDGNPIGPVDILEAAIEQGRCSAVIGEELAKVEDLPDRPAEGSEHREPCVPAH